MEHRQVGQGVATCTGPLCGAQAAGIATNPFIAGKSQQGNAGRLRLRAQGHPLVPALRIGGRRQVHASVLPDSRAQILQRPVQERAQTAPLDQGFHRLHFRRQIAILIVAGTSLRTCACTASNACEDASGRLNSMPWHAASSSMATILRTLSATSRDLRAAKVAMLT